MSLIVVQGDAEYVRVRRRCRFSMERECYESPAHRKAAVRRAVEMAVEQLGARGYQYVHDGRVELRGPEPHIEYSTDLTPDLGPMLQRPDPRDREATARFERAERSRAARAMPGTEDLADFILVMTFQHRLQNTRRVSTTDPIQKILAKTA